MINDNNNLDININEKNNIENDIIDNKSNGNIKNNNKINHNNIDKIKTNIININQPPPRRKSKNKNSITIYNNILENDKNINSSVKGYKMSFEKNTDLNPNENNNNSSNSFFLKRKNSKKNKIHNQQNIKINKIKKYSKEINYNYNNEELNSLNFEDAIKYDKKIKEHF